MVATNPMEIVKIRCQMQALKPVAERQTTMQVGRDPPTTAQPPTHLLLGLTAGAMSRSIQVVRELGLAGMYQGTLATLSRDIPFSLIFFPLYANLKKAFADKNGDNT